MILSQAHCDSLTLSGKGLAACLSWNSPEPTFHDPLQKVWGEVCVSSCDAHLHSAPGLVFPSTLWCLPSAKLVEGSSLCLTMQNVTSRALSDHWLPAAAFFGLSEEVLLILSHPTQAHDLSAPMDASACGSRLGSACSIVCDGSSSWQLVQSPTIITGGTA